MNDFQTMMNQIAAQQNNTNNRNFMTYAPHYEIVQVNGRAGAENFRMGPNSNYLLLDNSAAIIWLVKTDGSDMGNNNNNQQNSNYTNTANNLNNMMNNSTYRNYAQDVIPQTWYKYTRYDVDANTKRQGVKEGFKKWLDYEKETKQFLTEMAKYLDQMGEREASRKLDYLIDSVEKEIEHAEQKMIALENTNYDINYILQEQEPLKAKYAEKIRKLNMRDHQYRRRGMGNYANYNYDDDEDEEHYGYHEYRHLPPMYERRY